MELTSRDACRTAEQLFKSTHFQRVLDHFNREITSARGTVLTAHDIAANYTHADALYRYYKETFTLSSRGSSGPGTSIFEDIEALLKETLRNIRSTDTERKVPTEEVQTRLLGCITLSKDRRKFYRPYERGSLDLHVHPQNYECINNLTEQQVALLEGEMQDDPDFYFTLKETLMNCNPYSLDQLLGNLSSQKYSVEKAS